MKKTESYFSGIPTEPDVKKIRALYPAEKLKPGFIITYEELAKIIICKPKSRRFWTIVNRWRNSLEHETGIRMDALGGTHLKVLCENEKVQRIAYKRKSIIKQTRKNFIRTGYVDRKQLSNDEKNKLDHEIFNVRNIIASQQQRDPKLELPSL